MGYVSKGGFSYPIESMDTADRDWYLKRLEKQMKAEAKEIKKGNKGR